MLRADGSLAAAGGVGRVVVTSLHDYAQPMIRYQPGDLAEAGSDQTRCRRGLRSLRRILGAIAMSSAFATTPFAGPARSGSMRDMIPMLQSQVIQHDFDRIENLFVSDGRGHPIDLPALTERIRSVLGNGSMSPSRRSNDRRPLRQIQTAQPGSPEDV